MKVLCTGGAGFIASHIVDGYLTAGHQVIVIDNLSTGYRHNVNTRAKFYQVDIRNEDTLEEVFSIERPQVISHHAAQMDVRRSVQIPTEDATVNILGTLHLILTGLRHGLQQFIYASTGGAVYGEPRYLPVDEAHPINPICPYGISKHTVEHYLYMYYQSHELSSVVWRYPNLYGPRQSPKGEAGVVAIFSGQLLAGECPTIYGDGTKTRDYCYIDDIVAANLQVLGQKGHSVFNLGTGIPTSDLQVFETVRKAIGVNVEPRFAPCRAGEIQSIALDTGKVTKALGWQAKVTFEEGVRLTVDAMRGTI